MDKIGNSPKARGGGRALWVLVVVVAILIGFTLLTAPRGAGDTGRALATAGIVEAGPKPSPGLAHPGSETLGLPGTDSRDNGSPNAGRAAPASDMPPAPASAAPPGAGSKPA